MKLKLFNRWTWYWAAAGILAGGIVHIIVVLTMPVSASSDMIQRFSLLREQNRLYLLPPAAPGVQFLPFQAPDVFYAVCRFDLTGGPVSVRTGLPENQWVIGLYDELGTNFYAVSAADLKRRDVELLLTPSEEEISGAIPIDQQKNTSTINVAVPHKFGYVLIRAPLLGAAYADETGRILQQASCNRKTDSAS